MTPAPVGKLLAFLKGFSARERAEIEVWNQKREAEVELLKRALRAAAMADVLGVEVEEGEPPSIPSRPLSRTSEMAPRRLAEAAFAIGHPATASELATASDRSTTWVADTMLGHPFFTCVREKAGRVAGLYELTDAGRAAVGREG